MALLSYTPYTGSHPVFHGKVLAAFDTSCAVEQFLQYVYLPQGCVPFTAEPRILSPTSQFLNLNLKIEMLFEFQEEANDACRVVTLQEIFSWPWE